MIVIVFLARETLTLLSPQKNVCFWLSLLYLEDNGSCCRSLHFSPSGLNSAPLMCWDGPHCRIVPVVFSEQLIPGLVPNHGYYDTDFIRVNQRVLNGLGGEKKIIIAVLCSPEKPHGFSFSVQGGPLLRT